MHIESFGYGAEASLDGVFLRGDGDNTGAGLLEGRVEPLQFRLQLLG